MCEHCGDGPYCIVCGRMPDDGAIHEAGEAVFNSLIDRYGMAVAWDAAADAESAIRRAVERAGVLA